jgi:hypothetical protein
MPEPTPVLSDIPHITPIACPACRTGHAHLMRRNPDAFRRNGNTEIWTFKCDTCERECSRTVEN